MRRKDGEGTPAAPGPAAASGGAPAAAAPDPAGGTQPPAAASGEAPAAGSSARGEAPAAVPGVDTGTDATGSRFRDTGGRPRSASLIFLGVGAGLAACLVGAVLFMQARRSSTVSGGGALKTQCVGPSDAKVGLIYLHGIDPPDASLQERGNRRAMTQMADQLHLRIALARSPDACPREPAKRCWPNDSPAVVRSTLQRLLADSAQCFGGRSPQGLVGFSNGGFFVAKVAQYCLMPELKGLVTIGAAGTLHAGDPQDLSACPRLMAMIGRQDISRQWAKDYVRRLQSRHARVQLREYDGAHVLPPADLARVLLQLFAL